MPQEYDLRHHGLSGLNPVFVTETVTCPAQDRRRRLPGGPTLRTAERLRQGNLRHVELSIAAGEQDREQPGRIMH